MTRTDPPADNEVSTAVRAPAPVDAPRGYRVVVVEGPDAGKTVPVGKAAARVLVGTSQVCDLRLSDPQVSRRHASFDFADGRVRVMDLRSSNGTLLDGVDVTDAFARAGSLVRMGSTLVRVEPDVSAAEPMLTPAVRFHRVVGGSSAMRRLYPLCERLAAASVPVVIEGETGTGKEALAEALHEAGPRAAGPFVVFDCTATPANLLEAELFGHERGAFTGAVSARAGVFEQAHGGTLLIDEIGDLDPALQPKLLRVLERSEVRRLGATQSIRVDVRIIAATRRDLDRAVQDGRFRDDLFHRLAVARIELPPLRARRGDVALLAHHFWMQLGGAEADLTPELLDRWVAEEWPGNIRELRNAVLRRLALGNLTALIDDRDSAAAARPAASPPPDLIDVVLAKDLPLPRARQEILTAFERRYIERVLSQHGGSVVRAAAASGIARRYFQILRARST